VELWQILKYSEQEKNVKPKVPDCYYDFEDFEVVSMHRREEESRRRQ